MLEINASLLVFGLIVCGTVICAACSEDRREALILAAAFAASWIIHVMTWTPYGLQWMIYGLTGYRAQAIDVWSACNMLCGVLAAFLGLRNPARALLFLLFSAGCAADCALWGSLLNWRDFSRVADLIFLSEASAFYATGGGNAYRISRDFVDRWRLRLQAVSAPHPMACDATR